MNAPATHDPQGTGLARAVAAAGHEPPVLVIADSGTVGRLALHWLEAFDEMGWHHRVRLFGGIASETEIVSLAAEARSLGARTIAAIGSPELITAATAACKTLESSIGLVIFPSVRSESCR